MAKRSRAMTPAEARLIQLAIRDVKYGDGSHGFKAWEKTHEAYRKAVAAVVRERGKK